MIKTDEDFLFCTCVMYVQQIQMHQTCKIKEFFTSALDGGEGTIHSLFSPYTPGKMPAAPTREWLVPQSFWTCRWPQISQYNLCNGGLKVRKCSTHGKQQMHTKYGRQT